MIITIPQKRVYLNNYNLQLTYSNAALSVGLCEKVVGVIIDNNLTWKIILTLLKRKLFPMPQKELFKQSVIYSGPLIWNNLPENLR